MENIFEIKFSFEQKVKDNVILKFSNKQGGAYNVFSYHWQCFVWAAVVGFIHNVHIPADTRSAFPVISVQSPVSIQCCWQS